MVRLYLSLCISILIGCAAQAQTKWTLEDCITYAKLHNISVKQSLTTSQGYGITYKENLYGTLPAISGSGNYYFSYGKSLDYATNLYVNQSVQTGSGSLNGSLVLFNGLKKENQIKQSAADLESSKYDAQKIINDISLQIVTQFLTILNADDQLKLAKSQYDVLEGQTNDTHKKVDAGVLAEGNLLTLQAQLAQQEATIVANQNSLDIAKLGLAQLLNLDTTIEISVPDISTLALISTQVYSMTSLYSTSLKTQPQIKSYELKSMSAYHALDVMRGNYYPSLAIFGSLSTNYSSIAEQLTGLTSNGLAPVGFVTVAGTNYEVESPSYSAIYSKIDWNTQLKNNVGRSWGISLSVPIFNGFSTRLSVQQSKLNITTAGLNLDAQKQSLKKDVQTAYTNAIAAQHTYDANVKSSNATKEAFDYAQIKFDAGLLTVYDYNNAHNDYMKAKSNEIYSKYDLIMKMKLLDYYMGIPLKL